MGREPQRSKLVATSCHIPWPYLDRIDALGQKPSKFIREAVGEKLERTEGFEVAIEVQIEEVARMREEVEVAQEFLTTLYEKQAEWQKKKEGEKLRERILAEYLMGAYRSPEDLYTFIRADTSVALSDSDLTELVHEVWTEITGSED